MLKLTSFPIVREWSNKWHFIYQNISSYLIFFKHLAGNLHDPGVSSRWYMLLIIGKLLGEYHKNETKKGFLGHLQDFHVTPNKLKCMYRVFLEFHFCDTHLEVSK